MADQIIFSVQGSEPDPYRVVFRREGNNLTATCSCRAGACGMHCKHRLSLLAGKTDGLVSENAGEVKRLISWLPGTDVEKALQELGLAEAELERARKAAAKAKKMVARALAD